MKIRHLWVCAFAFFSASPSMGQGLVPSLAPMVESTVPTVVGIYATGNMSTGAATGGSVLGPLLGGGGSMSFVFEAQGSGVIVDAGNGYILTSNHVVDNASAIRVTLADDSSLEARLVGADPTTDLAVLQISPEDGRKLTEIPMGDSSELRVGDYVVAVGSPFGLNQSVTLGIVSGIGRSGLDVEGYQDYIQTDASINPGNSGGALVDLSGRLVGINSAIIGYGGSNIGVGFAIPIDLARQVMRQLIAQGSVQRGELGAEVQDLDAPLRSLLQSSDGVIVVDIAAGSAADRALLNIGDLILTIDGKPVTNSAALQNAVGLALVGDHVTVAVLRHGEKLSFDVELLAPIGNEPDVAPAGSLLAGVSLVNVDVPRIVGAHVAGAVVVEVGDDSLASRTGLQAGDLIVAVNDTVISTPEQAIAATSEAKTALVLVVRFGRPLFLAFLADGRS